jgi:hypothetical protein
MTLVYLAATLAVIVAGAVFAVWDAKTQFRKQTRAIQVAGQRGRRRTEDTAWQAYRHAEYEHAMTLTLTRANDQACDLVADLLAAPTLEVVA